VIEYTVGRIQATPLHPKRTTNCKRVSPWSRQLVSTCRQPHSVQPHLLLLNHDPLHLSSYHIRCMNVLAFDATVHLLSVNVNPATPA
jgi:hypothetical protein